MYPGYVVQDSFHMVPAPGTRTVNLQHLIEVLRSSDKQLWEDNRWMFDGEMRFLDGQPIAGNKVCFTSIHRSGNTFMRQYLEMLTGVATGGDVQFNIASILQFLGSKGEEIQDDRTWIVKSHTPWAKADSPVWTANKVICIVRNPMDQIVSYLHRKALQNHSQVAPFSYPDTYPQFWDWWVKLMAERLGKWYGSLLEDATSGKVPFYFVRFEDLISDPKPILEDLMKLLLNLDSLEGTNAQRRVDEVIAKGKSATVVYKLKDNTKFPNKNAALYNEEQQTAIKTHLDFFIHFFGYAERQDDQENSTGFYRFTPGQSRHEDHLFAFKNYNAESLSRNATQAPREYTVNDCKRKVEVINNADSILVPRAVIHDAQTRMFGKARAVVN